MSPLKASLPETFSLTVYSRPLSSLIARGPEMNNAIEYVISQQDEDADWAEVLPGRVTLYHKGSRPSSGRRLEDIGRESHTYLTHIITRFDSLAPITVFCKGSSQREATTFITAYNASNGFAYLSPTVLHCNLSGAPHHNGLPIEAIWNRLMPATAKPAQIEFSPGAAFYVTAQTIRRNEIAFYKAALALHREFEATPWVLERLWGYIFSANSSTGERYAIRRNGRPISLSHFTRPHVRMLPPSPTVGLVIGTFAAVPYIHLHLEARRRLFPDLPVLVHDDHSPSAETLNSLCQEYRASFDENAIRFPPFKGDLSAIVCGLHWARECNFDLLVKMSRRFIPLVAWTDAFVSLARESDYATYCSWTTSFDFGFRTECVAFAVQEWYRLGLVDNIVSSIESDEEIFVEGFVHRLAQRAASLKTHYAAEYDQRIGIRPPHRDGYAPWPLMGTDRRKPSSDYLWHDWASPSDYANLAQRWGLPYREQDFKDPNMHYGDGR